MIKRILMIALVGMSLGGLAGCISGKPPADTYSGADGKTSVIQSGREQCVSACNATYSRCMDSTDSRDNGGVKGPSGMFGESSECRSNLSSCLPTCKSQ